MHIPAGFVFVLLALPLPHAVSHVRGYQVQLAYRATSPATWRASASVDNTIIEKSLAISLFLLLGTWLLYVILRFTVSNFVRRYIESIDRELFGVDIFIKRLWISSMFPTLRVHIQDAKVCNPSSYKERYLATFKTLHVTLDTWRFLYTCLTYVDILELRAKHVLVHYEKSWLRGKSNVSEIIHFLYYGEGAVELPASGREYHMHKIVMDDIDVVSKFGGLFGTSDWHLPTEHMELLDVAKASRMDSIVRLVVGILLSRVQERHAAGKLQQSWRRHHRSTNEKAVHEAVKDKASS